jgi:hypothetical protein
MKDTCFCGEEYNGIECNNCGFSIGDNPDF